MLGAVPKASLFIPPCVAALFAVALAAAAAACEMEPAGSGRVSAVVDGRTLKLEDGREIRLAGIEVPLPSKDDSGRQPAGLLAKAALQRLAEGKVVTLTQTAAETDRYGRIVAFATVTGGDGPAGLQHAMLDRGFARVAARVGNRACAAGLLAREKAARDGKLGLWADPYYAIMAADNPDRLLGELGRFALVEGKVLSVRDSGGTIYMNFGRRWIEGFAVTILKRNERLFAEAGIELRKLEGKQVRVRGWIEERGGPRLEAVRPEQIEIMGDS